MRRHTTSRLEFLDLSSREEIEFVELWRIAMRPLLDSTGLLGFPMDAQMVLHAMIYSDKSWHVWMVW